MMIYDLADPQELNGFVRAIAVPQYALLNTVLPTLPVDDLEYRFTKGDLLDMDAATFRAFDAESPIGTRPGLSRMQGELPPISKKLRLGEEQRLRLRQLQGAGASASAELVEQVFRDAERLARSILARLELACGDAIVNGKVTIAENGVAASVDYGYVAGQKPVRTTAWSDPAADVIGDYTRWVEEYVARTGGSRPAYSLTSTAVRGHMLRNTAIRNLAASLAGTPQLVTVQTLGQVFDAFDLPPVRLYDAAVPVGGTTQRVIPADRFVMLPPGVPGRTFSGTTAEALVLAQARAIANDQIAGMTAVNLTTEQPVATWTNVSAIALPVLYQPDAITVATVL